MTNTSASYVVSLFFTYLLLFGSARWYAVPAPFFLRKGRKLDIDLMPASFLHNNSTILAKKKTV
jgi:hypothetical protein